MITTEYQVANPGRRSDPGVQKTPFDRIERFWGGGFGIEQKGRTTFLLTSVRLIPRYLPLAAVRDQASLRGVRIGCLAQLFCWRGQALAIDLRGLGVVLWWCVSLDAEHAEVLSDIMIDCLAIGGYRQHRQNLKPRLKGESGFARCSTRGARREMRNL